MDKIKIFEDWMRIIQSRNQDCLFGLKKKGVTEWYDLQTEMPSGETYYIPLDVVLETGQEDPISFIQSQINEIYDWDMGISPYKPMHFVEDIRDLTNAEWLDKRRGGIGGSDASALFGLNGFMTESDLFNDKRGNVSEEKDTVNSWFLKEYGHHNEELIAKLFQKMHPELKVIFRRQMFCHPKYPFMIVDCDGFVVDPIADKVYVLEIKTCHPFSLAKSWGRPSDATYPAKYGKQISHAMCVTNTDGTWLVCCAGNDASQLYRERFVPRNIEEEELLIEVEKDFWQHVESGVVPDNHFTMGFFMDQLAAEMNALGEGVKDISAETETIQLILNYLSLKDERMEYDHKSAALKEKESELMAGIEAVLCGMKVKFDFGDQRYVASPGSTTVRQIATSDGITKLHELYDQEPEQLQKLLKDVVTVRNYSFRSQEIPAKKEKKGKKEEEMRECV